MRETIVLPDIGEGVVEGEVVRWLKSEGDKLEKDEAVVVIMTDKATVELPTPYKGTLVKCYVKAGAMAKRGEPLYDVEREGAEPLAAPRTRKLAKELGVDLAKIHGTGKDGHITEEDLHHFSHDIEVEQHGIRKAIAEKMVLSKSTIPHFSLFDRLDATKLMALRTQYGNVTYMPFIIRALSLTITKYPEMNGSFDSETNKFIIHKEQKIGIAIDRKEGLIVAHLNAVQNLSLDAIIKAYDALIHKESFSRDELTGSTITISNFGTLGGRWATPIINTPEVAILGIARISDEAVVREKEIVIRPMLNLSWSFDHRVIDGSLAAKISNHFINLLESGTL